jgi:hypothetical protein
MSRVLRNKTTEFQRFTLDDGTSAQHGRDMKRLKTRPAGRAEIQAQAQALSLVKASRAAERMTVRLPRARPPEQLWAEIEAAAGPLAQLDVEGLKRALELALVEATLAGERTVRVPRVVAELMLKDLLAQQRRKPRRPRHRSRKNWWMRRWQETAVHQLRRRTRELRFRYRDKLPRDPALWRAAEEVAPGYDVAPSTLISWLAHPGRLRRK